MVLSAVRRLIRDPRGRVVLAVGLLLIGYQNCGSDIRLAPQPSILATTTTTTTSTTTTTLPPPPCTYGDEWEMGPWISGGSTLTNTFIFIASDKSVWVQGTKEGTPNRWVLYRWAPETTTWESFPIPVDQNQLSRGMNIIEKEDRLYFFGDGILRALFQTVILSAKLDGTDWREELSYPAGTYPNLLNDYHNDDPIVVREYETTLKRVTPLGFETISSINCQTGGCFKGMSETVWSLFVDLTNAELVLKKIPLDTPAQAQSKTYRGAISGSGGAWGVMAEDDLHLFMAVNHWDPSDSVNHALLFKVVKSTLNLTKIVDWGGLLPEDLDVPRQWYGTAVTRDGNGNLLHLVTSYLNPKPVLIRRLKEGQWDTWFRFDGNDRAQMGSSSNGHLFFARFNTSYKNPEIRRLQCEQP